MKILYIGPDLTAERMGNVSREHFPNLETDILKYSDYEEAPALIGQYPGHFDAVLFAGKAPFQLFEKNNKENIPCGYLPYRDAALSRALLKAAYSGQYGIDSLSMDTFEIKTVKQAYADIGLEFREEKMYFAGQEHPEESGPDGLLDFHRRNYRDNCADCCITAQEEIYRALRAEGIPAVCCLPTEETVRQSIENIQLRVAAQKNSESQIIVAAVKMDELSEYSLMKNDEYAYLSQRLKILDRLYHFSSQIGGILVEDGRSEFTVFATRKAVETETKQYRDMYLLDMLQEVSVVNTYIGIGSGRTANEAKFNAHESIRLAQRHGGQAAYVILEGGGVIGPIGSGNSGRRKENFDERFYQIARESGLSANTVYKIFSNIARDGKTEYTSKELAGVCGVSVRTMDRIVLKLCDAGYCEVISEKLMSRYGRPSRILRFKPFLVF